MNKQCLGTGKITQQLRALATLLEAMVLLPAFTWRLTIICNLHSGGAVLPSGLCRYCTQVVHIHHMSKTPPCLKLKGKPIATTKQCIIMFFSPLLVHSLTLGKEAGKTPRTNI